MKKIIAVVLLTTSIISVSPKVKAQEGFQLGIEGTPQLTWLLNKDDKDNANFKSMNNFGVAFGLNGTYGFSESIGLGLNALYSYQGQRFKLNEIERVKNVEYVKIPLMLVYLAGAGDMKFIGKIGPQIDLLTNAKLCDKDGNTIISDQKAAYESFDIGAVAYAGLVTKLGENFSLDIMLKFDYAFTDAEDSDYKLYVNNPSAPTNGNITDRSTTNNMTAGLTVGLRYLFMKKQ